MVAEDNAAHAAAAPARPRSPMLVIGVDELPAAALPLAQKAKALRKWRNAVWQKVGTSAATLRVAWALEWFIGADGFAACPDSFIAKETGVHVKNVWKALRHLEAAGLIIRAHVETEPGAFQRRIFV